MSGALLGTLWIAVGVEAGSGATEALEDPGGSNVAVFTAIGATGVLPAE